MDRLGTVAANTVPQTLETRSAGISDLPLLLELHRPAKATLGPLPDEAFRDRLLSGHAILALSDGHPAGYVLFDVGSRAVIKLVHLCVDPRYRSGGIARALVNSIIEDHPGALAITARCRRDYPANAVWPRLGFQAEGETTSVAGRTLVRWRRRLARDLLTSGEDAPEEGAQRWAATADLNIALDLCTARSVGEVTRLALGSVGADDLELLCTPALLNELQGLEEDSLRRSVQLWTGSLRQPPPLRPNETTHLRRRLLDEVPTAIRPGSIVRDGFDVDHVVNAVGAGADVFLTRDDRLRELLGSFAAQRGVQILHPDHVAGALDELRRPGRYTPVQLIGTDLTIVLAPVAADESLSRAFLSCGLGEKRGDLVDRLRVARRTSEASVEILCSQGGNLGVVAKASLGPRRTLTVFRTAGTEAFTAARFLAARERYLAAEGGLTELVVVDPYMTPRVKSALLAEGFTLAPTGEYIGRQINRVITKAEAKRELEVESSELKPATVAQLERSLRPLKVIDGLPIVIIPIRDSYAETLFDGANNQACLFPKPHALGLSRENVYFRSHRNWPSSLSVPARILWLITRPLVRGPSHVRACSLLDGITIAPAERLHNRVGHLGAVTAAQAAGLAGDGPVMALRFSQTELLDESTPWPDLRDILAAAGCPANPVQSPRAVPSEVFEAVYRRGRRREAAAVLDQAALRQANPGGGQDN